MNKEDFSGASTKCANTTATHGMSVDGNDALKVVFSFLCSAIESETTTVSCVASTLCNTANTNRTNNGQDGGAVPANFRVTEGGAAITFDLPFSSGSKDKRIKRSLPFFHSTEDDISYTRALRLDDVVGAAIDRDGKLTLHLLFPQDNECTHFTFAFSTRKGGNGLPPMEGGAECHSSANASNQTTKH